MINGSPILAVSNTPLINLSDKDSSSLFTITIFGSVSSSSVADEVAPEEVEAVLLQLEGVQQAVVYGKPNSVLGNVLCAELKVLPGMELTELQIRRYLQGKLQDFKIPRRIKFVEQFLLTRTGKIKR